MNRYPLRRLNKQIEIKTEPNLDSIKSDPDIKLELFENDFKQIIKDEIKFETKFEPKVESKIEPKIESVITDPILLLRHDHLRRIKQMVVFDETKLDTKNCKTKEDLKVNLKRN